MTVRAFAFMDEDIPAAEKLERFAETTGRMEYGGLYATSKEMAELCEKLEKAAAEEPEIAEAIFERLEARWNSEKKRVARATGCDSASFCIDRSKNDISRL